VWQGFAILWQAIATLWQAFAISHETMKQHLRSRFCLLLALLLGFASHAGAQALSTAGIFGDNMVLQRDRAVTIWGNAPAGTRVEVAFAASSATIGR